jgi:hypothetical protein
VFKLLEEVLVAFSIEAPLTLLQEPVETVLLNAVVAAQVTLGLVPEVLNAIDMVFTGCKQLIMNGRCQA